MLTLGVGYRIGLKDGTKYTGIVTGFKDGFIVINCKQLDGRLYLDYYVRESSIIWYREIS